MADKPMNVIVLTSDEMRGDCPSYMGNPDCKTPYLDEFADNAVVFNNHFTVHGKCVPSRIAMSTGRYCHTDGYRTINLHLPSDQPDLLSTLKKRGYESAVFGHNHVWEDFWGNNKKSSGCVDYHSYTEKHFQEMLKREWPAPPAPEGAPQPLKLDRHKFHYAGRLTKPIIKVIVVTRPTGETVPVPPVDGRL